MSLLSWERGLKFIICINSFIIDLSLLSWERGLKCHMSGNYRPEPLSLLSWERGLKYFSNIENAVVRVAPLVGAWIEIVVEEATKDLALSLLSWERGLKYQ